MHYNHLSSAASSVNLTYNTDLRHPSPEKGYTSTSGSIIFTKATF